ncbi:MAG: class I SAM-dependent methyltransferase [bacterium]
MTRQFVFDRYGAITDRRKEFLSRLLLRIQNVQPLKTALDVGCGVGHFAQFLADMRLGVRALDVRPENVAEARKRYPHIAFHVGDVEDPQILRLGPADMTLCFGLLYHLENPFRAIRHLSQLTAKVAIIESMVAPHRLPLAVLVDESSEEDQSLRQVAFVPSEACLAKMLYRAGFRKVYRVLDLPEHEEFRESLRLKRRRTTLVASKADLPVASLSLFAEPRLDNIWEKSWVWTGRVARLVGTRVRRVLVRV